MKGKRVLHDGDNVKCNAIMDKFIKSGIPCYNKMADPLDWDCFIVGVDGFDYGMFSYARKEFRESKGYTSVNAKEFLSWFKEEKQATKKKRVPKPNKREKLEARLSQVEETLTSGRDY
jgi:hypothetical protein